MKRKLFLILAILTLCGQLCAIEVYKSDNVSVRIFGELNATIGYGATIDYPFTIDRVNMKSNYSFSDANSKTKHSFMLGVQKDSRVGFDFNAIGIFGEVTLGLGENLLTNGYYFTTAFPLPNLRQLYLGYDFGKGGKILVGKTELNTSMSGFISDIANEEEGLWGFGAPKNSIRRFQISYDIAGFSASVSLDEASYYSFAETEYKKDYGIFDNTKLKDIIPKFSLAYEYDSDKLRAKVATSYACIGACSDKLYEKSKHIFYLTAGIKPYFGKSYMSFMFSYGLNTDLTQESKIWYKPHINQKLKNYGNLSLNEADGLYDSRLLAIYDTSWNYAMSEQIIRTRLQNLLGLTPARILGLDTSDKNIYATALEFGHNFTDKIALKIGLGYQIATSYDRTYKKYDMLHSFGGFIQVPCKINDYFTLIPQTGSRIIVREDISNTNTNEMKFDFISNSMALLLMKFTF